MTDNLDLNNKRIYNLAQPHDSNQPATKIYTDTNFLANPGGLMAGNLDLCNNKIINVGAATSDKDALSRVVADGRYLKLSGGTIAENLTVPSIATRSEHNELALNYVNTRHLFVEKRNA